MANATQSGGRPAEAESALTCGANDHARPGAGRPLRVAFVTPEYVTEKEYDGGLANYTQRVCLALAESGHHPVVFVGSDRDESFAERGIQIERVNIRQRWLRVIDRLTYGRFSYTLHMGFQSWRLNQRLLFQHRRRPFSIVQYSQLQAVGLFRPARIPAVVRLSTYTPMMESGYGFKHRLDGDQQHYFEMLSLKRVEAVFSPSRLVAEAMQHDLRRPVRVIESPFFVDAQNLDDTPYRELLAGKTYLLFFGRIGLLKGIAAIGDILQPLLERHAELLFVFVGKQGPEYQGAPAIEYIWNKAGPHRGRALYLGPMRHEQLYPILAGAAAVVLPSRVDNFPNACIEAMAFKRVVIGTRGTSFEQLLVEGESGFLCEPDNAGALLAAIERVLSLSPAERQAIGQRAAAQVERLRPARVVEQLLDFYSEVIGPG